MSSTSDPLLPNGWQWQHGDGRWGITPHAYSHYGAHGTGLRVFVDDHGNVNIEGGPAPLIVVAAVLRAYLAACTVSLPETEPPP